MEENELVLTEEGLQSLKDELNRRITIDRPQIVDAIESARALGDLSENSEYDEARENQAINEAKISELEEMIKKAKVIKSSEINAKLVHMGCAVKVLDLEFDEEIEYKLVGTTECNILKGRISDQSPIGAALKDKAIGDIVVAHTPNGDMKFKILDFHQMTKEEREDR